MNMRLLDWHYWPWVMAVLVAAVSVPVLLNGGPILCMDWPVHWSICRSMKSEIVPEQRWLWGVLWPQGNGGMVLNETYSLSVIVPWLLSYLMSVTAAQKVIFIASCELIAVSAYWTARRWCPRQVAAVAGLIALLAGINTVSWGMWYNLVSVALALLFLVGLSRFLRQLTVGNWVFACLMLTLAIYSHPLGAILGCIGWLAAFAYEVGHRSHHGGVSVLVALVLIPITSMLLAAPQLFPMIESPLASVASQSVGAEPFKPSRFDPVRLCALIISIPGIMYLWNRDRLLACIILVGLLGNVAIYLHMPAWLPNGTPFRGVLTAPALARRFAKTIDVLLILLMTASAAWVVEWFCARGRASWAISAGMLALGLVALGLYLAATRPTLDVLDYSCKYKNLCNWLLENAGSGDARVYVEDTFHCSPPLSLNETGTFLFGWRGTHLFGFVPAMAHVQQVNGFWGSIGPFNEWYTDGSFNEWRTDMGKGFFRLPAKEFRERLRLLNCGFAVVFSEEARGRLSGFSFMEPAADFEPFHVFKVRGFVPCWAWSGEFGSPLKIVRVSSIEYHLDTAGVRDSSATVSLAYAHRWHAYAGQTRLPIEPAQGLVRIALIDPVPDKIVLRYEFDRRSPVIGMVVGVFCLLMGASWTARLSRPTPAPDIDDTRVAIGRA